MFLIYAIYSCKTNITANIIYMNMNNFKTHWLRWREKVEKCFANWFAVCKKFNAWFGVTWNNVWMFNVIFRWPKVDRRCVTSGRNLINEPFVADPELLEKYDLRLTHTKLRCGSIEQGQSFVRKSCLRSHHNKSVILSITMHCLCECM